MPTAPSTILARAAMIASAWMIACSGTGERNGQYNRSTSPRSAKVSASRRAFHDCGEEQKPCR